MPTHILPQDDQFLNNDLSEMLKNFPKLLTSTDRNVSPTCF